MTTTIIGLLSLLLVLIGWWLRGLWESSHTTRPVIVPGATTGDSLHYWVFLDGAWHAFTDDQVATAEDRADRLLAKGLKP